MLNVNFIILGAGIGSRMGISIPKQYLKIHGEYVIETIIKTLCCDFLDLTRCEKEYNLKSIVMTFGNDSIYLDEIKQNIEKFDKNGLVSYVRGGDTRQISIQNAYTHIYDEIYGIRRQSVDDNSDERKRRHDTIGRDIFLIHDGTRPLVTSQLYYDMTCKTEEYDVCGCYTLSTDTIVELDEKMEFMVQRYNRSTSVCSETPQGFRGYIMNDIYVNNWLVNPNETECLLLGQIVSGKLPYMIQTDIQTRKLTHFEDIFTLSAIRTFKMKKNVLILGGTKGIGLCLVEKLLSYDFDVITASRDAKNIESAHTYIRERMNIELDVHKCDITNMEDIQKIIEHVNTKYGGVDVFVNCVGNLKIKNIEDVSHEDILNVIQPNFIGAYMCNKMVFDDMKNNKKHGLIVNMGTSGIEGNREGQSTYVFSKNALMSISESLMLEGKKYGISSFYVAPRRTNTEMRRLSFPNENTSIMLQPEDVADNVMELILSNVGNISEHSTVWIK
jgi:ribitol-5-phosphate 2-dehydrogenase (NADP+) / D-ribitol-5-phosphate cytidylyltransferase